MIAPREPNHDSSPTKRSTFRLTRELEKYGAAAAALAGRESIAYGVEGTKLQASEVAEMLLDSVLNQRWAGLAGVVGRWGRAAARWVINATEAVCSSGVAALTPLPLPLPAS
jgi:hypothetical protein